jgi:hydroxymethylpyrimidine/phosphomethylpyrimidine kinase
MAARFHFPLVVDPVLFSKNGAALLAPDAVDAFKNRLLPHAFLITPNLEEAALLAGVAVCDLRGMRAAAEKLAALGARAVLVKGGHLSGDATDVLYYEGVWREFQAPRIETRHTHGTGCTYSAAITASLAGGHDLVESVGKAKQYITVAIRSNPGLGRGMGPVNHHAKPSAD